MNLRHVHIDPPGIVGRRIIVVECSAGKYADPQRSETQAVVSHAGTSVVTVIHQVIVNDVHVLNAQSTLPRPEMSFRREIQAGYGSKCLCCSVFTLPN